MYERCKQYKSHMFYLGCTNLILAMNHLAVPLKAGHEIHYHTSPPSMGGDKGEGEQFVPLK